MASILDRWKTHGWGTWAVSDREHPDELLVHGDAPLPPLLAAFDEDPSPLHALALAIGLPAVHHLHLTWCPEARAPEATGPRQGPRPSDFEAPGGPWATPDGAWAWRVE